MMSRNLTLVYRISLFVLFFATAIPVKAGYYFSDTPSEPTKSVLKEQKKESHKSRLKDKKLSKSLKKNKKRKSKPAKLLGEDNYFGTVAMILFGAAFLSYLLGLISPLFIFLFLVAWIASIVFSILGYKRDSNPKRARVILIINAAIVALMLVGLMFSLALILFI